jgi:putative aldouronate transport system permease protein
MNSTPVTTLQDQIIRKRRSKYNLSLTMIAVPFLIFIFIFSYVPLFGWIIAFFDYKPGMKFHQMTFIGLKYFKMAFSEGSQLPLVLRNTFAMSLLGLFTSPLAVIFAIFLSEIRSIKFKKFIQTTTTLPNFISWVIVYGIAYSFFSIDSGFVNVVLSRLNLIDTPYNFLGNADIAWYFQTALGIWKGLGFGAIVYIAAIAGIDTELFDAAKVDGAGRFRAIWHITVPGVMPTFFVMLLLSISNMLNNGFDQYYVFYNAMVAERLNVLDYYLYRIGLYIGNFSYSTAMGMFKTCMSITLLFGANWFAKKVRGESII